MRGVKDERLLASMEAVKEAFPGLDEVEVPGAGTGKGSPDAVRGARNSLVLNGKARPFCELIFYGHTCRSAARTLKIGEDAAWNYMKSPHYDLLKAEVDDHMHLKLNAALLKKTQNLVIAALDDAREAMEHAKNGFLKQRIREWVFELYEKLDKMQPGSQKSMLSEVFKQIETRKVDANTTIRRERTFVWPAHAAGSGPVDESERVAGGEDRAPGAEEAEIGVDEVGLLSEGGVVDAEPENVGEPSHEIS